MLGELYLCGKCCESDTAENWNWATQENLLEQCIPDGITGIETIDITKQHCLYYICPNCNRKCYIEDGEITIE